MRLKKLLIIVIAIATPLAGLGLWMARRADSRRFRAELETARGEMQSGLLATAHKRLAQLAERRPADAELAYELGRCEAARGRLENALQAWERVPAGSPLAAQTALAFAQVAVQLGRLSRAEAVLRSALRTPGAEAPAVRRLLLILLGQQGRTDQAARLLESLWDDTQALPPGDLAGRLALLREHVGLDLEPFPLEFNQSQLGDASGPSGVGDHRALAIAHAYLATRAGDFDRARAVTQEWIEKSPQDPDVWRARLDWAVAAGQTEAAREAMSHIPASPFQPRQILELRAWFDRQAGDTAGERTALERLAASRKIRAESLVRLAELLERAGDAAAAADLRHRKSELDAALDRYNRLYREDRYADHLAELAGLAERLGRNFEARGFWQLALVQNPADTVARASLARLDQDEDQRQPPAGSLADAVGAIAGAGSDRPSAGRLAVVKAAPQRKILPWFEDDAASAGLARFVQDNGVSPIHQLPEMSSGGVALLDVDGDGYLDVYAVQGGHFPPPAVATGRPPGPASGTASRVDMGDRLFRNRGDGTFEDVTTRSGIAAMPGGYGHGVVAGDYDNDGHADLFVTRWRSYALYRNRGDGTFTDETHSAGLDGDRDWPTSAAFADFDGDGDLDLYVCHYGTWDTDDPMICKDPSGQMVLTCDPRRITALPDHVFRNDGGRFVDVTASAGIVDPDGRGFGVVAADLDDDGRVDLFVANDSTANYLFLNQGGFRFEEVGHEAGVAANAGGGYQAGMGVACGDTDGDGRLDLVVTNFYGESTTLFHNLGRGLFADHTAAAGLAAPSRHRLGFGVDFLDADNDGWLDLMTANGHVSDQRPLFPYAMTAQLFLGGPDGRLTDVTARAGPPFEQARVGRGLAVGDLDNDGRPDGIMVAQNDPLVFFHNRTPGPRGHFLVLQLEGTVSNRDGVGARVLVRAEGRDRVAVRSGGGSFQSSRDPRLHFGLGACDRVEKVEVRWPSGRTDHVGPLAVNRAYLLREGGMARPLAGFSRP